MSRLALLFLLAIASLSAFAQPDYRDRDHRHHELIDAGWDTPAKEHRGQIGERFTYRIPGNGTFGSLWGTEVFTDDSSIATAAVHQGLITRREGGVVTIEIMPGRSSYQGTEHNGVRSGSFGAWQGSFRFVDRQEFRDEPPPMAMEHHRDESRAMERHREDRPIQGDWNTKANNFRGQNGDRFTFRFPGGGTPGSVWGSEERYTDDSSIATAAVQAGLITFREGGFVTIEIRPGAERYRGDERHGVRSGSFGAWQGSFVFVDRR